MAQHARTGKAKALVSLLARWLIYTNFHVVEGAIVMVKLKDGREFPQIAGTTRRRHRRDQGQGD
jgi:hypothetical protein